MDLFLSVCSIVLQTIDKNFLLDLTLPIWDILILKGFLLTLFQKWIQPLKQHPTRESCFCKWGYIYLIGSTPLNWSLKGVVKEHS